MRAKSDMHHASTVGGVFHAATFGDVRRRHGFVAKDRFIRGQFVALLGLFISSMKENVRGIVMKFGKRYIKFP